MNRKSSFIIALVAAAILASCQKEQENKEPNILFAIADDWTWKHTSFNDYPEVSTPNFDRVAKEGIYFERAYCNVPSCTPSRATVLTGKNGWELEEGANLWGHIPEKYKLYTDILEDNGYFVGYTGKGWGPGNVEASGREKNPAGKDYNSITNNPVPELRKGERSGIIKNDYAANFEAFLNDKPEDQPFSFWYSAIEPHRPYNWGIGRRSGKNPDNVMVPGFFPDDSIIRNDILDYLFEVEWFDQHLGRILSLLEERGELENTLVIVTSDNGMPFPRSKSNLYEYGTHMPLAIMWKNEVKGGRRVSDFVNFIDFAPTFLEAAKLEVPENMTGKSLMPILLSEKSGQLDESRNRTFSYKERHGLSQPEKAPCPFRSIRKDDWLLIWSPKPGMWPAGHIKPKYNWCHCSFGDVDGSPTKYRLMELAEKGDSLYYKLAYAKRPEYELYDVRKDPYQLNNLADDPNYQDVRDQLIAELEAYLTKTNDPRMSGRGEIFKNAPYYGPFFEEEYKPSVKYQEK